MQNSSEFQYIAIDTIHESATNPRRTFDECKLGELGESIRTNGLIQPITVRPESTPASRLLQEPEALPCRAACRVVFPSRPHRRYRTTPRRLSGSWSRTRSASTFTPTRKHRVSKGSAGHARLRCRNAGREIRQERSPRLRPSCLCCSLCRRLPRRFSAERITASHANLLARLPQDAQANAYEQCWRKDWQDKEPHLLPAKHLSAWIQTNLYLSLADAPFEQGRPHAKPTRRSLRHLPPSQRIQHHFVCRCPGRSLSGRPLLSHQGKRPHRPRRSQPVPSWCRSRTDGASPQARRAPEPCRSGTFREVDTTTENPDAEPIAACEAAKPAIIVYGKRVGSHPHRLHRQQLPRARSPRRRQSSRTPRPRHGTRTRSRDSGTGRGTPGAVRGRNVQAHQQEEERRAEERRQQEEREEQEREAEFASATNSARSARPRSSASCTEAPPVFTAPQLRVILRALVNLDPYTFADDLAEDMADENEKRSAEEVLLSLIEGTGDDKLTSFAVRLALAGHRGIPREGELDFLTEAEAAFLTPKTRKAAVKKAPAQKQPTPIKPAKASRAKQTPEHAAAA